MRLVLLLIVFVFTIVLGSMATLFLLNHPRITSVGLGEDTDDALAAIGTCKAFASWHVELQKGQPMLLEQRICPVDFHSSEYEKEHGRDGHQVLLLEERKFGRIRILAALFSDLEFAEVTVGKTQENSDAILWSYDIMCGSCHGGPDGVLIWSQEKNTFEWNHGWFDAFKPKLEAKLDPMDAYADDTPALGWLNYDKKKLQWSEAVYGGHDANCCPTHGHVTATFVIFNGHLKLDENGFQYQKPD